MPEFYRFPCNCEFEIIGPPVFPNTDTPALLIDYKKISMDCKATWRLLATGKTKKIFQLEKGLGQKWTKILKPESLDHLAALGAILRPGSLKSLDENDVSMTSHYCKRKNGDEEVKPYHPVVDEILAPTYGCLIYQEPSMKLAMAIAGFTEQEADSLRKSIGKKLADEMAKNKRLFIEKAKTANVVSEAQAAEVFSWIEKSQRYAFNKSHAVEYGLISYWCAFSKTHFPAQSYTSWLNNVDAKPFEEIAELVADAKTFGFDVYPPDFSDLKIHFQTDGDKKITFGIGAIKGIGEAQVKNIVEGVRELEGEFKPKKEWTWYELLILAGSKLSKTAMEGLILTGGFRHYSSNRSYMKAEYDTFRELTTAEIDWIKKDYHRWTNLADAVEELAKYKQKKGLATQEKNKPKPKKSKKNKDQPELIPDEEEFIELATEMIERGKKPKNPGKNDIDRSIILFDKAKILRNPITPYQDKVVEIAANEEKLLGVALTCSIADAKSGERWTMTCKELLDNPGTNATIILKAKIEEANIYSPKKGKNEGREMAFLKMSDGTCAVGNITCWPDQWEGIKDEETGEFITQGFKYLMNVGRVLEIQLDKGFQKKGQKPNNNLHVKDVWVI